MELVAAVQPADITSEPLEDGITTYCVTAELAGVSYLDDCDGGAVEFRTDVREQALVMIYFENDPNPVIDTITPEDYRYTSGDLASGVMDYVQDMAEEFPNYLVKQVRVTLEWTGLTRYADIYDKRGALVTSDQDDFGQQVDYSAPTLPTTLEALNKAEGTPGSLSKIFDHLREACEARVKAQFANILNRYYFA